MKKLFKALLLIVLSVFTLASCGGSNRIKIAIPNDSTNEERALLLLEREGLITLNDNIKSTATIRDIKENPYDIIFEEIDAPQIPRVADTFDFAVINSNYAIPAGFDPLTESLAIEDKNSPYANILAVKEGNENTPKIKALNAALSSKKVKDFITSEYKGAVISVVDNPFEDGFDPEVDYEALKDSKITVAASPVPHAEILKIAKEILATKGINLVIKEYADYVQPNHVVDEGEVDANYFQHEPYLNDFNKSNNTHIVCVSKIHVEPLGIYSVKHDSLEVVKTLGK